MCKRSEHVELAAPRRGFASHASLAPAAEEVCASIRQRVFSGPVAPHRGLLHAFPKHLLLRMSVLALGDEGVSLWTCRALQWVCIMRFLAPAATDERACIWRRRSKKDREVLKHTPDKCSSYLVV